MTKIPSYFEGIFTFLSNLYPKIKMMKKILLILFCLNSIVIFGQSRSSAFKDSINHIGKNEIKLNVATACAGLPEVTYERFVEDNIGLGLSCAYSLETPEKMTVRASFSPFSRIYFGKNNNSGFFIELSFSSVNQREKGVDMIYDSLYNYVAVPYDRSKTNIGFGAAVGLKFLTRNRIVGELYTGGGRLFGESINGGFARVGLCLGKRF
jgi:hypothetical protein